MGHSGDAVGVSGNELIDACESGVIVAPKWWSASIYVTSSEGIDPFFSFIGRRHIVGIDLMTFLDHISKQTKIGDAYKKRRRND